MSRLHGEVSGVSKETSRAVSAVLLFQYGPVRASNQKRRFPVWALRVCGLLGRWSFHCLRLHFLLSCP